jgi:DNA-binding NtrC family response regulator
MPVTLFREQAAAHELMLDVQGTRIGAVFDNSRIAQAIDNLIPSAGNTIEAMRLGAFDHLTKPIGRDDLMSLITRMLRSRVGDDVARATTTQVDDGELAGPSDAMRSVQKMIGLVTDSDATVLITGEGKEL